MTYETKNVTFHVIRVKVSSDSRCSRTLPMNVAIESAHRGCERNSCRAERERERDFYSKGRSVVRACQVLMGGEWSQDQLHPPPKGVRM